MTFGSLFSGIGGFDLGLERSGMTCKWQVEIDKNCLKLLEDKFPHARRYTDIRECRSLEPTDLICGGFPCQDLSVAGKRKGLAGERSGLWFEFHRVLEQLRPQWVVIENVPGLLSSNKGRDFAVILSGLAELRYRVAWRVLDAQYFGLAQRRKRVFIVASLGNGRCAEVLFESESGAWDPPPRRGERAGVAAAVTSRIGKGGFTDPVNDNVIPYSIMPQNSGKDFKARRVDVAQALTCNGNVSGDQGGDFIAYNIHQNDDQRADRPNGGLYVQETDLALTPASKGKTIVIEQNTQCTMPDLPNIRLNRQNYAIPFAMTCFENHGHDSRVTKHGDLAPTLKKRMGTGGNNVPLIGVRRLTPLECERLQGFPDNHTAGFADSTRYRMLGNAVAVPCAEWIGKRIMEIV